MKKVFADTNVVIDLLEKREGFYKDAMDILRKHTMVRLKFIFHQLLMPQLHICCVNTVKKSYVHYCQT